MGKLSQNEFKKFAKMRHIKNYKNMSREQLLISLLKTEKSIAELRRSKYNNADIEEAKQTFNELRNMISKEKIKKLGENFVLERLLASI